MATIILLIVDAIILMVLMRLLVKEQAGLLSSFIAAALGAFGAMILTGLAPAGPNAGVIGGLLASIGVGAGIWFVFHISLVNSVIIGFVFLIVRSAVYYLLNIVA